MTTKSLKNLKLNRDDISDLATTAVEPIYTTNDSISVNDIMSETSERELVLEANVVRTSKEHHKSEKPISIRGTKIKLKSHFEDN